MKFLCVSLILLQLTLCGAERVFVTGTLMCGDKPYKGALVKLIEKGKRHYRTTKRSLPKYGFIADPIKDDEMGKMTTGVDGKFSLDGTSSEIGNIEPVLKIYHDCDDTVLGKEVVSN